MGICPLATGIQWSVDANSPRKPQRLIQLLEPHQTLKFQEEYHVKNYSSFAMGNASQALCLAMVSPPVEIMRLEGAEVARIHKIQDAKADRCLNCHPFRCTTTTDY